MIETFKITIYQIGPGQGWWLSKVQPLLQITQIENLDNQYIDEKIKTQG